MKKLVLLLLLSASFWSNCFAAQQIPHEVSGFLNIRAQDIKTPQDLVSIKNQYHQLALKYHPDKNPTGAAIFKRILNHWQNLQTIVASTNKSPQEDTASSSQGRTPTNNTSYYSSSTSDRSSNDSPPSYSRPPTPPKGPTQEEYNRYYTKYQSAKTDAIIAGKTSFMTFEQYLDKIKQQKANLERTAERHYQEEIERQERLMQEQERIARERQYAAWDRKFTQQYQQSTPNQRHSSLSESSRNSFGEYSRSTTPSVSSIRTNSPAVSRQVEPVARPTTASPAELTAACIKDKKLNDFLNFPVKRITNSLELDKSITDDTISQVSRATISGDELKDLYLKKTGIYNAIQIQLNQLAELDKKIRTWQAKPLARSKYTRHL